MKPICGIYLIRNLVTEKSYVGSSCNTERRLRIHRWRLGLGNHHSKKLQASWNKHGAEAFVFEVIEIVDDPALLLVREQHYIDSMGACKGHGYNMSPVAGSPMLGVQHSEEAKKRIGAAFRGIPRKKPSPLKGRKLPEEWVRNASATHIGKKRSPETCARISEACKGNKKWLGRKHTPESIEKIKAARRARASVKTGT